MNFEDFFGRLISNVLKAVFDFLTSHIVLNFSFFPCGKAAKSPPFFLPLKTLFEEMKN